MKHRHPLPQLNTTSTADISFMLLIFFLVTTSMDIDKGIRRQLPPVTPDVEQEPPTEVDRRKTITITIAADGTISADSAVVGADKLPQRLETVINGALSDHIIIINPHPDAPYDAYFQVQNHINQAYLNVRNSLSQHRYHRPYAALSATERRQIRHLCPQRITENYSLQP